MTVLEIIKKYELEDYDKSYKNVYGNSCNLINLDELKEIEVKDIYINLRTNTATITIFEL